MNKKNFLIVSIKSGTLQKCYVSVLAIKIRLIYLEVIHLSFACKASECLIKCSQREIETKSKFLFKDLEKEN